MEQSPSREANIRSSNQEIPHLLWYPKFLYRVYKSPPLDAILATWIHSMSCTSFFLKIQSNIILPSTPRSSKRFDPFRFLNQKFVRIPHLHTCYMPHPFHSPWFDRLNNMWLSAQIMKLLIMQSSPASCHFLPLRSKYSQHPVLTHPQSIFFP
jgi:hypothetical protein